MPHYRDDTKLRWALRALDAGRCAANVHDMAQKSLTACASQQDDRTPRHPALQQKTEGVFGAMRVSTLDVRRNEENNAVRWRSLYARGAYTANPLRDGLPLSVRGGTDVRRAQAHPSAGG